MDKIYTLEYSEQAIKDLDIFNYICFSLRAPTAAENQLLRIKNVISSLSRFPMKHPLVEWEPWASMKIYKVPIDNYVIFYSVDDNHNIVSIVRIFYSCRNIEAIIKNINK